MGGTHRGETDLNRGLLKRILVLGEAGATSDCLQNREWHLAGGRHTERIIVHRVYGTHWRGQHERCRHQVHSDGPYHVKGHFKIVTDGDREIAFDRNEAGSAGAAIRRTSHSATAHTRRAASRTTWTRSRNRQVDREEELPCPTNVRILPVAASLRGKRMYCSDKCASGNPSNAKCGCGHLGCKGR